MQTYETWTPADFSACLCVNALSHDFQLQTNSVNYCILRSVVLITTSTALFTLFIRLFPLAMADDCCFFPLCLPRHSSSPPVLERFEIIMGAGRSWGGRELDGSSNGFS